MAKHHISATLNGEPVEFLCSTRQTLLDVLRDELNLTGSKEGCASGDCGACSVMVDDRLVCACLILGAECDNKKIDSIEGMADGEKLHPLQTKFLEEAALHALKPSSLIGVSITRSGPNSSSIPLDAL